LRSEARADAMIGIAHQLSGDEVETALSQLGFPHDYEIARELLAALAAMDPERALSLANGLPVGEKLWIKTDPSSATGYSKEFLLYEVLKVWVESAPEAAVARAVEVHRSMSKWSRSDWFLSAIFHAAGEGDLNAVAAWRERYGVPGADTPELDSRAPNVSDIFTEAAAISDQSTRADVLQNALMARAEYDPGGVRDAILVLPRGTDVRGNYNWFGTRFSGADLIELRLHQDAEEFGQGDWAEADLERRSSTYPTSFATALNRWASVDPRAALEWAGSQPEPAREYLRAQAMYGAGLNDPEFALAGLGEFSAARSEEVAVDVALEWFKRDQEAAREWAASTADQPLRERLEAAFEAID
jgi:hypothetical protein